MPKILLSNRYMSFCFKSKEVIILCQKFMWRPVYPQWIQQCQLNSRENTKTPWKQSLNLWRRAQTSQHCSNPQYYESKAMIKDWCFLVFFFLICQCNQFDLIVAQFCRLWYNLLSLSLSYHLPIKLGFFKKIKIKQVLKTFYELIQLIIFRNNQEAQPIKTKINRLRYIKEIT